MSLLDRVLCEYVILLICGELSISHRSKIYTAKTRNKPLVVVFEVLLYFDIFFS